MSGFRQIFPYENGGKMEEKTRRHILCLYITGRLCDLESWMHLHAKPKNEQNEDKMKMEAKNEE